MFRRKFIQQATSGLVAIAPAIAGSNTRAVTYRIEGFTCVTCAVGLDTMLKDLKGIVRSKSSYADRTSVIEFNPDLTSEPAIKGFISEIGFAVRS
jgi:copper chaperone CopZ